MGALDALESAGAVRADDADVLRAAYRFCERTRNRWWLVGGAAGGDALPQRPDDLSHLARSLDTTPPSCATTTAGSPGGPGGSSSACSTARREKISVCR